MTPGGPGRPVLVKACLNGGRRRSEHNAVPETPDALAAASRDAVAAGAAALHVHPRTADGAETLHPDPCAAVLRAIRLACPGVPIGLTTGVWIAGDPAARLALVGAWTERPDFVSVNVGEPGTAELCALLTQHGIGIEAGIWTVGDARRFVSMGLMSRCLRVLIEVQPTDAAGAVRAAAGIDVVLDVAGVSLPRLYHGEGPATWAVLDAALQNGSDIRIGFEDTLELPDGRRAPDNAALVGAAIDMVRRRGSSPAVSTA